MYAPGQDDDVYYTADENLRSQWYNSIGFRFLQLNFVSIDMRLFGAKAAKSYPSTVGSSDHESQNG